MQIQIVILVELAAERAIEQLHLGVSKGRKLRRDGHLRGGSWRFRPCGDGARGERSACRNRSIRKELAPRSSFHDVVSLGFRWRGAPEACSVVIQEQAGPTML